MAIAGLPGAVIGQPPGFVAFSENIKGISPAMLSGRYQRRVPGRSTRKLEVRVLDERFDAEPGIDQRSHDLAEAVVPAMLPEPEVSAGSAYEPFTSGSRCSQYG